MLEPTPFILTRNFLCTSSPLSQFSEMLGFCYLHDNHSPVIGLLPQVIFTCEEHNFKHYMREEDFSYNTIHSDAVIPLKQRLIEQFTVDLSRDELDLNLTGFNGGLMGFISYDYAAQLQIETAQNLAQPSLVLGIYDTFLKKHTDGWYVYCPQDLEHQVLELLNSALDSSVNLENPIEKSPFQARWTLEEYSKAFQSVQDYIVAGDCYQINLTQEFKANYNGSLNAFAPHLWQLTDAPYQGYLKHKNFELLSASPELFVEFRPNRKIVTRPIKGTMPRSEQLDIDIANKQMLANSVKDQAENVMIVDLLRNDLSLYAEIGSVKTNQLFEIESFEQVHHMVSEVEATLRADIHPLTVLFDALPGGSITGAPKIRAMQIIDELEQSPRGAYCGSLGYLNWNGTGRWNILIRSLQKFEDTVSLWAGGGVTIASTCEAEYQECFDKVTAIIECFNEWQPHSTLMPE